MKPLDRPPYLLTEYSADQWWFKELESLWGSGRHPVTLDTRRAAKVACDFVRAALEAQAAAQARIDALMLEHCPEEMTKEQVAEWGRNQHPVDRPASNLEEKLEGDREAVGAAVRAIGERTALTLEIVRRLQRQHDEARGLLLWALYCHQGGSSPVGQPIRRALGIGQHDRLTPEQIEQAKAAAQGSVG